MKLILKNEYIHLDGTGRLDLDRPVLTLDTQFIPRAVDYKFLIRFNKGEPVRFRDELVLPQAAKLAKELTIDVEAVPIKTDVPRLFFTSDKLPITRVILLGKDIEEVYPEKIKELEKRIDVLENQGTIF